MHFYPLLNLLVADLESGATLHLIQEKVLQRILQHWPIAIILFFVSKPKVVSVGDYVKIKANSS